MSDTCTLKKETHQTNIRLNWMDNPAIQKLLDVISSIIAEEYIETAKKNKDVFQEKGSI